MLYTSLTGGFYKRGGKGLQRVGTDSLYKEGYASSLKGYPCL
jgi:hypothetical protein